MKQLIQLSIVILPLVPFLFWFWMLLDMSTNDNGPHCFPPVTRGRNATFDWWVACSFLSVFTARVYDVKVY